MLATAGGKTLTMANLLERGYAKSNKDTWKVLVIVPDLGLVNQTFSDFENYEVSFSFSKWTGNNDLDITSNVGPTEFHIGCHIKANLVNVPYKHALGCCNKKSVLILL